MLNDLILSSLENDYGTLLQIEDSLEFFLSLLSEDSVDFSLCSTLHSVTITKECFETLINDLKFHRISFVSTS